MIKNLVKSLGMAVLMVIFPVAASVIIQVNNIEDDTIGYGIQAAFFAIASVIGFILYRKSTVNNTKNSKIQKKELLWFIPVVISELIVFASGVNLSQEIVYYVVLLIFTIFVGISEELFFRGIILNILKSKSLKYAIFVSSILFSVLHLTNLAGGISIRYAILQVIFSFIFGIVAAQITVITKSLLPAIVWHFSHDFIAFVTGNELNTVTTIILVIQCCILIIYSFYLNKKIR
ncbi:MAG: lysostaphin resistance A-like protein [Lysinibacillus sp.]